MKLSYGWIFQLQSVVVQNLFPVHYSQCVQVFHDSFFLIALWKVLRHDQLPQSKPNTHSNISSTPPEIDPGIVTCLPGCYTQYTKTVLKDEQPAGSQPKGDTRPDHAVHYTVWLHQHPRSSIREVSAQFDHSSCKNMHLTCCCNEVRSEIHCQWFQHDGATPHMAEATTYRK